MADFKESPFKPMSDSYRKLATSLLSSSNDSYKKDVYKGIGLQVIADGLKGVGANLKQSVLDGANDVKEEYANIFQTNQAEYESFANERERLKRYNENKETFLNEEAARVINNTDEAVAARVTWSEVDEQPEKIRSAMYKAFNDEREKIQREMEALAVDPRVKTRTFQQFNERARNEYLAALKLVEDDPTKKGLVRNLWNRVFKTKRTPEGELVTTNESLLKLQKDLEDAKKERSTFRDSIERQQVIEGLYTPLEFKSKDIDVGKLYFTGTPVLRDAVKNNPEYTGVKDNFFHEALDVVRNENPGLTSEQIITKAYMQVVNGQFDPAEYYTRDKIKSNAGRNRIETFEKYSSAEKRQHIEEDPTRLFKLQDAYVNSNEAETAKGLAITYKDIFEENKSLEATPQQKQTYIEIFRGILNQDPKANKAAINDVNYQANIGTYASIAENYFTRNNKDWDKKYDPQQFKLAVIGFINRNEMSTRMTEADLIHLRLTDRSTRFDESILDDTPKMITELVKANREEDIIELRNKYIEVVNTSTKLELNEDEREELKTKIDSIFINSGQLSLNPEDIESGAIYRGANLPDLEPSISDVDFNPMPLDGGYYLKNANKLVSQMDLESLSDGQLLTLRLNTMPRGVGRSSSLPERLGLPSDISLDSRKTSGLTPLPGLSDLFATPKVRVQLRNRVENELKNRDYSGPIMMAKREDFEPIPDTWWDRYRIENPRGIVNTRGLRRGSKYNIEG